MKIAENFFADYAQEKDKVPSGKANGGIMESRRLTG